MALRSMNLARKMVGMDVRLSLQGINSLHTSSRMQMGFGSHSSDNDPDVIHEEKEKHLSGTRLCLLCLGRSTLHFSPRSCKEKVYVLSSASSP